MAPGRWIFRLYPAAAEGGGAFRSGRANGDASEPPEGFEWHDAPYLVRWTTATPGSDAVAVARRRARGKVRRYCAANGLNRLGTLTYAGAGCHEPLQVRRDVGVFIRRLRGVLGEPFPYVWVPEWHAKGHGLHVHFAVGRFIAYGAIDSAWGHGFVHIKLLGHLPVGSGVRGEARLAARYLSKYVGKDLGDGQTSGLHRYEVGQGFQPGVIQLDGTTADEVVRWAETVMGAPAGYVWRSSRSDDWPGPPAVFAHWP